MQKTSDHRTWPMCSASGLLPHFLHMTGMSESVVKLLELWSQSDNRCWPEFTQSWKYDKSISGCKIKFLVLTKFGSLELFFLIFEINSKILCILISCENPFYEPYGMVEFSFSNIYGKKLYH